MRYLIFIMLALYLPASAAKSQKQSVNLELEFSYNYDLSKQYMWCHFVAKNEKAIAYKKDGSPVTLSTADTIMITGAETGSYDGHTGTWLKPARDYRDNLYIFLNDDIKEVTEEARTSNQAAFDHQVNERLKTVGYGTIPFLLFALITTLVSPKRVKLPDFLRKNIPQA